MAGLRRAISETVAMMTPERAALANKYIMIGSDSVVISADFD
jgi:hypothetical protein